MDEKTRNIYTGIYTSIVLGLLIFVGVSGLFDPAKDDKGANKPAPVMVVKSSPVFCV